MGERKVKRIELNIDKKQIQKIRQLIVFKLLNSKVLWCCGECF